LTAILALYGGGLVLPEVDPGLDSREEAFFDHHDREAVGNDSLKELGGEFLLDPEGLDTATIADDLAVYLGVKKTSRFFPGF
jgi:hypothetical protein